MKQPEFPGIGDLLRGNLSRPSYGLYGHKSVLPDKMSGKEKLKLKSIIDYPAGNKPVTSSKAIILLDVESKTAKRFLVKAVEPGILYTEGENKTEPTVRKNKT